MVLPCHLVWKWIKLFEKKNNYKKKMTTTQRRPKRKVEIKVSWWGFIWGKVNVGVLHVAVCGAEGKDALPYAEWRQESVRPKLNNSIIHPWAAFHQSALSWKAHADTETHRRWKTDTPKQTRGQIHAFLNTPEHTLFSFKWCAKQRL